jgi:hypothetical protein
MKKITLVFFCLAFFACKKDSVTQTETSAQVLTKIIKTADFGGGTYSVDYAFNDAGKIIAEGNIKYMRDDKQRIIQILDKGTPSNREDVRVFYSDANSNKVAYTFCNLTGSNATDSVVYLHDETGRLTKLMHYIHYFEDTYVPDTTYLYQYDILSYDANGNLLLLDDYKPYLGQIAHCVHMEFDDYNTDNNLLYSDDEVRILQTPCGGFMNSSPNNFVKMGVYMKTYVYRADGRPHSCIVKLNGKDDAKFVFEYK